MIKNKKTQWSFYGSLRLIIVSSKRHEKVFTTAETLDYPDFYHRLPDVAEDTNVAGQEIIFLALLTLILYTCFPIVSITT